MSNKIQVGALVRLKGTQITGMVSSDPKPALWGKLVFRVHSEKGHLEKPAVYYWTTDRVDVVG